jgi:hypothetical protein
VDAHEDLLGHLLGVEVGERAEDRGDQPEDALLVPLDEEAEELERESRAPADASWTRCLLARVAGVEQGRSRAMPGEAQK